MVTSLIFFAITADAPPPYPPPPHTHPRSLECLPSGQIISVPQTMEISSDGYTFNISSTPQGTLSPNYIFAPTAGFGGQITKFENGVISIRDKGVIECYGMAIEGGQMSFVSLGGAGVGGYPVQCAPQSYNQVPDVATKPKCLSQPGSKAPYQSTVLFRSTSHSESGAAGAAGHISMVAALLTALALVAAAAL